MARETNHARKDRKAPRLRSGAAALPPWASDRGDHRRPRRRYPPQEKLKVDMQPAVALVRLRGEVDHPAVQNLRSGWHQVTMRLGVSPGWRGIDVLAVDLSGVTFMDAAGLGLLVSWRNEQVARGGRLILTNAPLGVMRLLRLAGLLQTFPDADRPWSDERL